jgi:hypothetical protein
MIELATLFSAQNVGKRRIFPLFYKIGISALKDVETERRLLRTWETYAKEDARVDPGKCLDAVRALLSVNGLVFDKVSEVAYRKEIVRSIYNLCPPDVEFDLDREGNGESPPRTVPSMRYHLHLPGLPYRVSMYHDSSPWLSRGHFRTDGRTDDRTMAAGASMT